MLYTLLRRFLRHALDLYFVDVRVSGHEQVPDEGPVLLAANHPSSALDAVLLTTQTERQVQYLARSGLFERPVLGRIFNLLGAVPVYRREDDETAVGRNEESFERVYERFEAGGCVGIFPEGRHSLQGHVLQLRTGAARMALNAEARNDYGLGLAIVPVGISLQARARLLSSVLVRFGAPIRPAELAELHRHDERAAVRRLTEQLQEALRAQSLHIESERNRRLVEDLRRLLGRELLGGVAGNLPDEGGRGVLRRFLDEYRSISRRPSEVEDTFDAHQAVAETVAYLERHEPETLEELAHELEVYQDHLRQIRLRNELLDRREREPTHLEAFKLTTYAVLFAPVALWGFVHNVVPYLLSRWIGRRQPAEAIRIAGTFGAGVLLFPLLHLGETWAVWRFTPGGWIAALLYLLTLAPAGFFFLRYRSRVLRYRSRVLARTLFRTNRNLVRSLTAERGRLLRHFETLRARAEARGQDAVVGDGDEAGEGAEVDDSEERGEGREAGDGGEDAEASEGGRARAGAEEDRAGREHGHHEDDGPRRGDGDPEQASGAS